MSSSSSDLLLVLWDGLTIGTVVVCQQFKDVYICSLRRVMRTSEFNESTAQWNAMLIPYLSRELILLRIWNNS
jgi:hypothetical protein